MSKSQILKALASYGDSFLDDGLDCKRKARREKLDKKPAVPAAAKTEIVTDKAKPLSRKSRELENIKNELCLAEVQSEEEELTTEIPTAPAEKGPLVVVFEDRSKSKKKRQTEADTQMQDDDIEKAGSQELGLDKARFDILKFGIKGLEKPKQEEAKIAFAVRLGAKPPKNKYVNYKQLIEERKQQKVLRREQKILDAKMGILKAKKKGRAVKKGPKDNEKHGGIKYVSKKLISKVQRKSGKR